jgi:hypothetical protein
MEDNDFRRSTETNILTLSRSKVTIAKRLGAGYNARGYKIINNIIF